MDNKKPKVIFAPKKVERGAKQPEQHIQRPNSTGSQHSHDNNQVHKPQSKPQSRNRGLNFDLQQFQVKNLYSQVQSQGQSQFQDFQNQQYKYEQIEDEGGPIDLNAPLKHLKQNNEIAQNFQSDLVSSVILETSGNRQIGQSNTLTQKQSENCSIIQFPGILPFQSAIERGLREQNPLDSLEPGLVGKLIKYKSGRRELELGGVRYKLFDAPSQGQTIQVYACDARNSLIQQFTSVDKMMISAVDFTQQQKSCDQ